MKSKRNALLLSLLLGGCGSRGSTACDELRIGMSKAQVEQKLGTTSIVHKYDARTRPADLYLDVTVYTYKDNRPAFGEPDVVYIANREDEVIRISCQDRPIHLRADGTSVSSDYANRWRIDKNPPANKKVTPPQ